MRKLNRILVPIDFSEESARALRYALSLVSTRPRRDRGVELYFHLVRREIQDEVFVTASSRA